MNDLTLHLYNTATLRKDPFIPLEAGKVRLYCCGPTVYHYAHIGNLRAYVFEDVLRRALEYAGLAVHHIVNITDVGHLTSDADTGDDKMEKGALREGKSVWEIADFYTRAFQADWKRLNLREPTRWARATDHIAEQIDLVRRLDEKGYVYRTADGLYFDTARFPRYGEFARLDLEGLRAGHRIDLGDKKSPTDFALWKFSPADKKRAMEWDSPFGRGFPGWHLECSAMAMKHLGETLDIHCGGTDHIRVHHTNEIAQSECATGHEFSRFWLHGGWLLEQEDEEGKGGKMSKSSGDFLTLDTLIGKGFDPLDYRYFCLTAHYRNYLRFSFEGLESARDSLKNLRRRVEPLFSTHPDLASPAEGHAPGGPGAADRAGASALAESALAADGQDLAAPWRERFGKAVADDLNMPQALAVLFLLLKDADTHDRVKARLVSEFDAVLGLDLARLPEVTPGEEDLPPALKALFEERLEARRNKDWKKSDEIREIFKAQGYTLKDSPQGGTWSRS